MQIPTNYKMGTGLAATMLGQENAQESERQTLANLGQLFQNQKSEYEGAEAQAKMQDPRYMQMKLQADMSKFGKETSINEIETAYNKANRAVAHLQAAQAMGPQALQQAAMQYLNEMDIDPNSEKGQILLKDPIGNAEKMVQFYATAATNNPEYLQKYSLGEQAAQKSMDVARLQGENALKVAQLHEGGANARANQTLGTDKMLSEMITRANAGDQAAQQWVNTYAQIQRYKNPGFSGATISPTGQLGTKGDVGQLPYGAGGAGGNRPPLSSFNK